MIQVSDVQRLVAEHLQGCEVEVQGEGNKFQVTVVGPAFEGLNAVKRQQKVYGALMAQLADGSVHAVTIKAFTPDEWRAQSGS